ncbi:bifunctional 5,10-methylenetetrahydrofolate dehydrogenase/5,10-methenyltetrahydrofolate cyclohydrolase [Candidatus Saccharibacteria bacterium]|nr:bifunctional 5,10-methylenetetrahydrofolate dehydrogenase/5,10-methenyltetrahydrofolate cyclohydrolase [Candidatus Saccharibacteria bacterium]
MVKELSGRELAGFVKERQAHLVRSLKGRKITPKLLILRDSDNPVITKYVTLKQKYGDDIGVIVEDFVAKNTAELKNKIVEVNNDKTISGMIVQLPLIDKDATDDVVSLIAPEKDVDGLSGNGKFDSATATAINWLLAGYDINLENQKIALVGRGRLVGAPLYKIFTNSNRQVEMFHRGSNLEDLNTFDIIITATGVPHLIKSEYIKENAVVVDAGTASEKGVLMGDVDEVVRERGDLKAITPKLGGVGPLTVSVLFENVIFAAQNQAQNQDQAQEQA